MGNVEEAFEFKMARCDGAVEELREYQRDLQKTMEENLRWYREEFGKMDKTKEYRMSEREGLKDRVLKRIHKRSAKGEVTTFEHLCLRNGVDETDILRVIRELEKDEIESIGIGLWKKYIPSPKVEEPELCPLIKAVNSFSGTIGFSEIAKALAKANKELGEKRCFGCRRSETCQLKRSLPPGYIRITEKTLLAELERGVENGWFVSPDPGYYAYRDSVTAHKLSYEEKYGALGITR